MPALILPLVDAATHWPERGGLIGLDLGTKTIGVAVSNPDRRLATGVETIQRKQFKQDAARLLAVTAMLVCYALEDRSAWFILGFAAACALGSAYGFLQGAWPFGVVEAIWAAVALRRWRLRMR